MRHHISTAVIFLFTATSVMIGAAAAKPVPSKITAVVELFTSQGCSSCPPADKLLKTYVDRKDVIALTLPVDYWDYLGWKDTLASPRNTQRQRAYAITRGDGQVYTPQVVVNGLTHVVGSRKTAIDKAIKSTSARIAQARVAVNVWVKDGTMIIEATPASTGSNPVKASNLVGATIWLATVQKKAPVKIRRGENSGHKISYYNVVKDLTSVGMWYGKPLTVRLARHSVMHNGANGCIVFVQQGRAGPIIGAAELKHW